MNLLDQPLERIARDISGVAALREFKLEVGGNDTKTLREALAERGIDELAAIAALDKLTMNTASEANEAWQASSSEALIEHILSRYHDAHREQLPELIHLAQRVERVHGSHLQSPVGLAALLERTYEDLEDHMSKEETILFPMITRGISGMVVHPMAAMRREHEDHAAALAEIDRLTHGLAIPEGACRTWRSLYQGLAVLKADLKEHIELENDVLFTRIEAQHQGVRHG